MSISPPALVNPERTRDKLGAAFGRKIDWSGVKARAGQKKEPVILPALDLAALSAKYGMAHAHHPKQHEATFTAPLGATWAQYERLRNTAVEKFVAAMSKLGYESHVDVAAGQVPQVGPGMYPAHDLRDGIPVLDRREFVIRAWFRYRNPQPIRLEVDAAIRDPVVLRQ